MDKSSGDSLSPVQPRSDDVGDYGLFGSGAFPLLCSNDGSGSQAQAEVVKKPSEADVESPTRLAGGDGSHDEAGTTRHGPSPLSNSLSSVQPRSERRVIANLQTAPGLVVVAGSSGPGPVRSVPKAVVVSESLDVLIARHEEMMFEACRPSSLVSNIGVPKSVPQSCAGAVPREHFREQDIELAFMGGIAEHVPKKI